MGWHGKVYFRGWRRPSEKWNKWVQTLRPIYQSLWKQAGTYEAIMGSTYVIKQQRELILGVAERWSPETNTFIFPWGEATITLEDVMVCGGYSVLGSSVSSPLRSENLVAIEEKLIEACKEAATIGVTVASHSAWMDYFMGTTHELQHEAFLSLWLSRFVLLSSNYHQFILKHAFPIAIRLAGGTQFALAPVLWIWERFPALRPIPNPISMDEPRLARWYGLRTENVGDVGLALDLAGESFQWRPYGVAIKNWDFPKFYGDEEQWLSVDSQLDEQSLVFARFLRVSELVGVGCIEQYLPHRVAMQFGLDQDLPGSFARCNGNPRIAWRSYNRPINDAKLYIPPRLFESDVSTRYSDWWNRSNVVQYDAVKPFVKRQRSSRTFTDISARNREHDSDSLSIPPGFALKHKILQNVSRENNIDKTIVQTSNADDEAVRKVEPLIKQEKEEIERKLGIKDGKSISCGEIELEARILRLERELAELKAERFGNRLKKFTEEGS
ncbi:hypothetical protein SLEP1_g49995 [Rubroshorea leprosula]|uniref:Aminotransferase-like plant mobile domain-containing protein n=1 Tax=Rubroshorea leprosula TaxID=152421 RepID=A0AAV5M1X7_9ROSI|nr:hypothetical protein SLEP1_g49995 [Rubroshorea leprosula]